MSTIETKQETLKKDIVAYLNTCNGKKCLQRDIWNNVSSFLKTPLSCKNYGVSKMHSLLDKFSDVLLCEGEYVCLRTKNVEVIEIDSESDEEASFPTASSVTFVSRTDRNETARSQGKQDDFRERLITILLNYNGKCGVWQFLDKYQSAYGPLSDLESRLKSLTDFVAYRDNHLLLQPKAYEHRNIAMRRGNQPNVLNQTGIASGGGATSAPLAWGSGVVSAGAGRSGSDSDGMGSRSSSVSSLLGFIPLSDETAASSPMKKPPPASQQAQASHQRYGLNGPRPLIVPVITPPHCPAPTSGALPLIPLVRPEMQVSAANFANNFMQNFRNILQQPNQVTAFASPALVNPQMAAPSSQVSPEVTSLQPPAHKPPASEWPRPSPRTGPPPGTKITDEIKEIIVKPILLPRGSRLTSEQVNYQVQECIDVLCEAKEHVSMERLELMLLQKYQVRNFQSLNLRERLFDNLQAAKDHSMKIGKVNAYVQSFVRSRSLCTLYELQECCREFHPDRKDFEHLKLGPLQKMPIIHDLFKFPMDEYIPEITSVDLIEHLHDYLDRSGSWTKQVTMDNFMKYLLEVYHVSDGLSLGIRMRSVPLAIQMLKKSKRDAASSRKACIEELQQFLSRDIQESFRKFRASILQTTSDGSLELRRHYMNLSPEDSVRDIITKFELLAGILMSDSQQFRKVDKMLKHFDAFVKSILEVPIPRMLYHLSVCLSDLQVQESAQEFIELEAKRKEQQAVEKVENASQQQKKPPPTKVGLTEKLMLYLNRCLEHGSLQLSHLGKIESKVVEDFGFSSFQDMGYGKFLEFILSETKTKSILEECGGTVLGSSSGSHEAESIYKPSQLELLEFICQARHAGVAQNQHLENALTEHFHVSDVRYLGHGNITRLCSAADRPGKHVSKEYHVNFEAALCGKLCPTPHSTSQVGIQGSQTKETAMACLTTCPLLEDMMEWSHWPLVFQPQLGSLRTFIEKHGGLREISLEGGHKTAVSDFMALEVEPGKFLKICSQTTQEQFCEVLDSGDPAAAAGYLVSLIVTNKGLESTPLALLANHIKSRLITLHANSPGVSTPGGPPSSDNHNTVDLAVQFVTELLLRLPVRICVAIANQVLLEPLSSVVGSSKSKRAIMQACKLPAQIQRLELLGCLLGLPEWTTSMQLKFEFPSNHMTEVMEDDLIGPADVNIQEEEEVETEEESESEDSDIDSLLSDDGPQLLPQEDENVEETVEDEEETDDENVAVASDGQEESDIDEGDCGDEEITKEESPREDENSEKTLKEKTLHPADEDSTNITEPLEEAAKIVDGIANEEVNEKELTREQICQRIVETIQREEFGLGIQLDETGEKLMKKQQERQGRSLQRLSKDLYSKETHFVLELIQNADDNAYNDDTVPAVKFTIDYSGVTVLNNELGFEEKNIRALCDVGKSTKEKNKFGYIGQKGIGFKSVFRVTGRPEVHSNGFHICFDVQSGPIGYILPEWISEGIEDHGWQTRIVLPWTEEIKQQIQTHAARFNDIQPSLLLFLHRLKEITIENKVEGSVMTMRRTDLQDKEVQISHSYGTDRWLVLRKILDASGVSVQMKSGVEVESTEIALAFPLQDKTAAVLTQPKPNKMPVFAFLPLRSYGFRFIVQGDFDVPSSREDVDRDSSWNQWLRNEIHVLFVEALDAFKARPELSPIKALISYLQFVPLEGEVMDFFKPVVTKILALLRAKECMPVLTGDKKNLQWKMPSKTVIAKDALVLEIISPELLQSLLGLYYLHPDVAAVLNGPLIQALGVETITTEHLLHIGQSIGVNWDNNGSSEQVTELAKWLACVYRSLDDFQENTQTFDKLRSFRIIPLSDGSLVSLSDVTVFLLTDGRSETETKAKKKGSPRDPLLELRKDLNIVHTDLTNTGDNEVNSQVVKILLKMGIKQMTAHDLIHSHILPVLKSDAWKEKKRDVLISYVVYIKTELDQNPSVVEMSELQSCVRLATNNGMKSPEADDVHFSSAFGNKIDLTKVFPGIEWTLVDSAYLPHSPSRLDVQTWHEFLTNLGVVEFLRVRKTELHFDKSNIHETAWAAYKDWPESPDGYTVVDFQCEEFHKLVTDNRSVKQLYEQMAALYEMLDMQWDREYKRFTHTALRSGSGHVLKDTIQTSFAIYLETLPWVPSIWKSVTVSGDNKTADSAVTTDLRTPAELYTREKLIQNLLAHTVKYLNVDAQKKSSFTQNLKIKSSVDIATVKEALISWCRRDEAAPDIPKTFCTTMKHILELYFYLSENLSKKDAQDLFHNYPAIFVPVLSRNQIGDGDVLVGKMLKREEVWWSDPTELFTKHRDSLELYKSPLAKRKFLQSWYPSLGEMFELTARIDKGPNTYDLAQLLKHITTVSSPSDPEILKDALFIFSKIGSDLSKISSTEGGVKTMEAMKAEIYQPKVVDLLTKAAVFPTKEGQWVSLTDKPMIADSTELEQMFQTKPGVHFLQLEVKESGRPKQKGNRGAENKISQTSLKYCLSLFDAIKPLSDCIKTEEITSNFQQCRKGQKFMHDVVGLLQRFLFVIFPDVYEQVKEKKAGSLKELLFSQVERLEVRYELIDHPDVYEIRQEKCVVKDKHFFFHEQYINSQTDINREVAKYFSEGNEDCVREMRSFLSQIVPILEGTSDETIEELFARQKKPIGNLPPDEEIWEVPPPIIEVVPEPVVTEQVEAMVYSRALPVPGVDGATAGDAGDEPVGIKSWPPRSALFQEPAGQPKKRDGSQPGIWPPPQGPSYAKTSKLLPSTIKFEKLDVKEEDTKPDVEKRESQHGAGHGVLRQTSQTDEHRGPRSDTSTTKHTYYHDGHGVGRQPSGGEGARDESEKTVKSGDGAVVHRQTSAAGEGRGPPRQAVSGEVRQSENRGTRDGTARAEDGSVDRNKHVECPSTGDKRKRKLTDRAGEDDTMVVKRINSQEGDQEPVSQSTGECAAEGQVVTGDQDVVELPPENGQMESVVKPVAITRFLPHDNSSSREVTPSSSSSSQDVKRHRLHFTIPVWNENFEDVVYTELAKGHDLTVPAICLSEESPPAEIGQWGEKLVWDYLERQRHSNSQIVNIMWANAFGERGFPYDFEIVLKSGNSDEIQTIYIEVKSTLSWDKEVFPVSSKQIEFALQQKDCYEIYRVYGAGNRNPRLVRVDNVAEKMRSHAVRLFMVL